MSIGPAAALYAAGCGEKEEQAQWHEPALGGGEVVTAMRRSRESSDPPRSQARHPDPWDCSCAPKAVLRFTATAPLFVPLAVRGLRW